MKISQLFLSAVPSVLSAPAIIWSKENPGWKQCSHHSQMKDSSSLIVDTIGHACKSSAKSVEEEYLASVIFLVSRDASGKEAMTQLAGTGALPETFKRYEDAHAVYYNVDNLESRHTIGRDAAKATKQKDSVIYASLAELEQKLESLSTSSDLSSAEISATGEVITSKAKRSRVRALEKAKVIIVQIDPSESNEVATLDILLSTTVDSPKVYSVILAGIRSSDEVKRARKLFSRRQVSRRRLDAADDDAGNDSSDGVYYVNMTPNILAGLLFMFMFTLVTWLGIMCMGEIQGQDVYVTKMPSIGREA